MLWWPISLAAQAEIFERLDLNGSELNFDEIKGRVCDFTLLPCRSLQLHLAVNAATVKNREKAVKK